MRADTKIKMLLKIDKGDNWTQDEIKSMAAIGLLHSLENHGPNILFKELKNSEHDYGLVTIIYLEKRMNEDKALNYSFSIYHPTAEDESTGSNHSTFKDLLRSIRVMFPKMDKNS